MGRDQKRKGEPVYLVEQEVRVIEGTVSTAGDNTIVPAGLADERIVVTAFVIQNESQNATTMILKDGPGLSSGRIRFLGAASGGYLSMVFPPDKPWRLLPGNPVVMLLSGANQCGYTVFYYFDPA